MKTTLAARCAPRFAVLPAVATLQPQAGVALQTRIGIATGLVGGGEIGTGTHAAEQGRFHRRSR